MQFEAYYSHSKSLYEDGNGSILTLRAEIGANQATGGSELRISSLKLTVDALEEIDQVSIQLIKSIHTEKKKILTAIDCQSALQQFDPQLAVPAPIDGNSLKRDKEDLFNSKSIQNKIIKYRNTVIERVANSHTKRKGSKYKYVNSFDSGVLKNLRLKGDNSDFKLTRHLLSDVNPDDIEGLIDLIINISPRTEEDRMYSAIEALHYLCIQEVRILDARKRAFSLLQYRYSFCGNTSFDKIMPLAVGPSTAQKGDVVELQVMIAALEWDNDPIITCDRNATIEIKDGIGYLNLKVDQTTTVKGTISIRNKVGALKTSKWEKKIVVQ